MAFKQKEVLQIEGMSCGHCVEAVRDALAALDGVEIHDVGIGEATISYDADAVDHDRIVEAVEDEGYTVVG